MKFKSNQRRSSCCIMLLQRWRFKPGWSRTHPSPFPMETSCSSHQPIHIPPVFTRTPLHYMRTPPPRFHLSLPFTLCLLKSENRFLHISCQAPVPNPHDKAHHPLHSILKCVMPGLIKIPFPHLCAKNINAGRPASLSS